MTDRGLTHGWKCNRCDFRYVGPLQWHSCPKCGARGTLVLEYTELVLPGWDQDGPTDSGWEHDFQTGRSRYWHPSDPRDGRPNR